LLTFSNKELQSFPLQFSTVYICTSVGTIYRIVSNITILASYRYRDNSPPNKTILRTTLISHINDSR